MKREEILEHVTNGTLRLAQLAGVCMANMNLSGVDLSDKDLTRADFTRSTLNRSDFRGSDLTGARFDGAEMLGANFNGADLRTADLRRIKHDVDRVLREATQHSEGLEELLYLAAAIEDGRIVGTVYQGECCCLVGTLAKSMGVGHTKILGLTPDVFSYAEVFFMGIKKGDTPATSQISSIASEWVGEFIAKREFELGREPQAQKVRSNQPQGSK